jgi:hypothetical protein
MPAHKNDAVNKRKDELITKIDECTRVVREVENSDGWKIILRDFERQQKMIDDNWQSIFDKEKLDQLRVTKFATKTLLDLIETYKHDLEVAKEELHKINNPNTILNKYYDGESNYE